MTIDSAVKSLVKYGIKEGLLDALDEKWAINRVLEVLELDSIEVRHGRTKTQPLRKC